MSQAGTIILVLAAFVGALALMAWVMSRALANLLTHVTALASEILNPVPVQGPEPPQEDFPEPQGPLPWETWEAPAEPVSVPSTESEGERATE